MTTSDPVPDPNSPEAIGGLLGEVFDLADQVAGTVSDTEVDEKLRGLLAAFKGGLGERGHMYFVLSDDGEPVPVADVLTWAQWFEDAPREGPNGLVVARDQCGDAAVSTVFIGLNHDWGSAGVPLLFETMIFGGTLDGHQWRYSLRAEALRGHADIVAALRAGIDPGQVVFVD